MIGKNTIVGHHLVGYRCMCDLGSKFRKLEVSGATAESIFSISIARIKFGLQREALQPLVEAYAELGVFEAELDGGFEEA